MNRLFKSLSTFPTEMGVAESISHFAKLSLADLGFYVSDTHAMKYFADKSYPLAGHALLLENALHQCAFKEDENRSAVEESSAGSGHFVQFPWKNSKSDIIGCSTLCENDTVTMCWFVVPPQHSLALHDHPSMHVWQRVLHGSLHLTSIDWTEQFRLLGPVELAKTGGEGIVVFSEKVDGCDGPVEPASLFHFSPEAGGGVLHSLTNQSTTEPALFIDIISPPYERPPMFSTCTYFGATKLGEPFGKDKEWGDSGIVGTLAAGDKVRLVPRIDYKGPPMDAYVHISA